MTDQTLVSPGAGGWDFSTPAYLWDCERRAIVAGADRLESLSDADRERSLGALSARVHALTAGLDDGWLVATAFFMVDDLYKSYFHQFRWSSAVHDYIAATAGVVTQLLTQRGFVLHYVIDNIQTADHLGEVLTYLPAVFRAAGLLVTGPQLMALNVMTEIDHRPADVNALPLYRAEGHHLADRLIERCHRERLSSVYLNLDLADDAPGLALDVALSQANVPGTIAIFRHQAPIRGSVAGICPPPGVALPAGGGVAGSGEQ